MDETLLRQVEAWRAGDPGRVTVEELAALVEAGDEAELVERFSGRLAFGTAGIRGEVGAGPNRINLAVVRQTAWGLGRVLLDHATTTPSPVVIVGNDARPDSPRFARDVAGVLSALGCDVSCFDRPVPTPLVAWLARQRGADAAVVVTASHNPRPDNGIKVYDHRAVQIIPPLDGQIASAIAQAPRANEIEVGQGVASLGREVEDDYRRQILARLPERPEDAGGSRLQIVATALHGVGGEPLERLLADAGHTVVHVPEQREPDGTFPTLPFPNPEEPGALDLALALAAERAADLVLANDPDADRLAVALPHPDGGHRPLTGNEVGVLLADALLEQRGGGDGAVVASSIVSSPQLVAVAGRHGAEHRFTLTGFKWIWTALADAEASGRQPLFGYEEALGYAVDPAVRDKDGLSAALAVVDLAAREAARGRTLADRLDDLARTTGLWVSTQASARFEGDDADQQMAAVTARLRAAPPMGLDDATITDARDWSVGADDRPAWLGAQDLLSYEVEINDGSRSGPAVGGRILVRPSGTEPKLKVYVDLTTAPADPAEPRAGRAALTARADALAEAMLRAMVGGATGWDRPRG